MIDTTSAQVIYKGTCTCCRMDFDARYIDEGVCIFCMLEEKVVDTDSHVH